jgi:ribosomal-protein-alanine N-acetyltransferase
MKDAALIVRPATQGDVPAIVEIERLSFVHAGEQFGQRKVDLLIRSTRAITLVAEADERIAGWAAGFNFASRANPHGRVYALAIHPDWRGLKLGENLLRHLIDDLHRAGPGPILLEVRPDNSQAIRLYEKLGFSPIGVLPNFYGPRLAAQRMRLPPV